MVDGLELPLARPDATERLEVARAFRDGVSVTIEGLAVSAARTRPVDVVLFVDDRPLGVGADPSPAVDGDGADLERWGFVLQVPRHRTGDATLGTLVAIYADHAVAVQVAWH